MTLVSTTDGIDSSTPANRMILGVLGSLAEYERELVKERTALKRQASRANRFLSESDGQPCPSASTRRRAASDARTVYRGRLRLLADATTAGWLSFRCSSSTSLGRSQLAITVQFGRWKDHHCTACHFRSPMAGER